MQVDTTKQRVVIAGGSGLIGTACRELLLGEGYEVIILTRSKSRDAGTILWHPDQGKIAENVADGAYAVINLCGLSLAEGRWTPQHKRLLQSSRVVPARFLAQLVREARIPPMCYVGMSAIGIYGDQGDKVLVEDEAVPGVGFVPELVKAWEGAHREVPGGRQVILRTGVVMTKHGGFLGKMLPPARFGMFPYFGNGRQILSWIHIDDFTHIVLYALRNTGISGIYHATAPGSVSYRHFMYTLRHAMRRPGLIFGLPQWMMQVGLGEMASMLFESSNVQPHRIQEAGFRFSYPDAEGALLAELSTPIT